MLKLLIYRIQTRKTKSCCFLSCWQNGSIFYIYFVCVMVAFSVKVHSYTTLVAHWLGELMEIIHANLQRVTAQMEENARWKNFDKTFRLSVSQTLRHF